MSLKSVGITQSVYLCTAAPRNSVRIFARDIWLKKNLISDLLTSKQQISLIVMPSEVE